MKQTTKSIFIYIGGIFTGILLTLIFAFAAARDYSKKGPSYPENDGITTPQNEEDPDLTLFDSPKDVIPIKQFEVMQVIPNGSALATADFDYNDMASANESLNYDGTIVMFLARKGESFYDQQKIKVPKGKVLRQIGVYRYITRNEMEKTVPVVDFFDK